MHNESVFLSMGTLAAHTQNLKNGFRQREVRFFSELFSNWIEIGGIGAIVTLHNTQIGRYLASLANAGHAKIISRKQQPLYRLTRGGLFELLTSLTQRSYLQERLQCYLVWYFLRSYTPQLIQIFAEAGSGLSRAYQIELEGLLDRTSFIKRQIQFAELELRRLNERVDAAHEQAQYMRQLMAKKASMQQCIQDCSERFPHELNSQRPLKELLTAIPEELAAWELMQGAEVKASYVFEPIRDEIKKYKQQLERLLDEVGNKS